MLLIGMSAWFFFDGLYTYPFSNERWTAHQKFEDDKRLDDWPAFAKSRNWSPTPPHKFYNLAAIRDQFGFGVAMVILGAGLLGYWFKQKSRTVKTDNDAVYTPSGERVPFGSIVSVDRKQWDSKGLATVRFQIDGRGGKFVLDDYKFNAEATRRILLEIDEALKRRGGTAQ